MKKLRNYINKHKVIIVIFLVIVFFLSFSLKYYKFNVKYKNIDIGTNGKLEAMVIEKYSVNDNKISYIVIYNNDKFLLNIYANKYSLEKVNTTQFVSDYSNFKYGDVISFRGSISIPEKLGNEGEFNYKNYLNSKDIVGTISTYDAKLSDVKIGNVLFNYIYNIKDNLSRKIDKDMNKEEATLFKSMVYGDDLELDSEIKENFEKSGISHLLVVSGTHMSSIILLLNFIYKFINKKNNKYINIFVIIVFCILSSSGLSIMRATIMGLITVIFNNKNNINIYLKIAISIIIILIYNPYSILNSGMILSYFAVIGIVMFQSQIYSFFKIKLKYMLKIQYIKPKGIKSIIYKILKLILYPLSITISVQIMLLPISLYLFGHFYLITFLSNIIISYIDSFFSFISFIYIICINIPYLSGMLAYFLVFVLKIIINLTSFLSKFDILEISIPRLSITSYLLYYSLIILYKLKKYIKVNLKNNIKRHFSKILCIYCIFVMLFIISNYTYITYFENYVYYFNVKQGNMALIHKNGKNIIVDIGSTTENLASNILLNFAKVKNIKKIDLILLTHMHTDHINGVQGLINNIEIGNVAYSIPKEDITEYFQLKEILEENKISVIELEESDEIKYKDIDIKVISPPKDFEIEDSDSVNANSMVIDIKTNKSNLLFMGDATKQSEKYFLNKSNEIGKVDVLQVGHHGSSTSTSDEMLNSINIKNALISSRKKVYGHPSEDTLNILKKHNINIWITEKSGRI